MPDIYLYPGEYQGPGDLASDWIVWAGLRAFSFATIGANVIELRENGTNTTQIFTSLSTGALDWTAINTFRTSLGGLKVFARTLYDQASGIDLIQTTNASQPELQLNSLGSNGTLYFGITASEFMNSSANLPVTAQPFTASGVCREQGTNQGYMFSCNSLGAIFFSSVPDVGSGRHLTAAAPTLAQLAITGTDFGAFGALYNGAQSRLAFNGTATGGLNMGSTGITAAPWGVGGNLDVDMSNMNFVEVGMMAGSKSSAFSDLSANQRAFWSF